MPKRSPRLLKKIHKVWLSLCVLDVSQSSYWRAKLFKSKEKDIFTINRTETTELSQELKQAIERHNLQYCIAVAPATECEAWLGAEGNIIFNFWASQNPTVKSYSGNNPEIL
jgi:pentose-5-phosphate-3-epimerase